MFEALLSRIAAKLRASRIPYMVIGGQAMLVHGEPRLTRDIDITLGVSADGLDRVLKVAGGLKLKPLVSNVESFTRKTMVLPLRDERSGIRVEFIFSFSAYEREAIARAINVKLGRSTVRFVSVEDLVVHKIIAGRPRDMEDAKIVLIKNPSCDRAYVRRWLKEFDAALNEEFTARFENLLRHPD